jgi:hypothetical protein
MNLILVVIGHLRRSDGRSPIESAHDDLRYNAERRAPRPMG